MSTLEKKNNWHYKAVIAFALVILGWILPTTGEIQSYGWLVILAFASLIFCNINRLPGWIPVLVVLIFCQASNVPFMTTMVPLWFGNLNLWLLIAAFFFSFGIRDSGLVEILTGKILSMRIAKKGPYWLMFTLLLATFVTNAITQSYPPVLFLMFDLINDIVKKMDMKPRSGWALFAALGIGISANIAFISVPFSGYLIGLLAIFRSVGMVYEPNLFILSAIMIITWIVVIPILIAICKYIVRPELDAEKFKNYEMKEREEDPNLKKSVIGAVISLVLVIIVLALPYLLPTTSALRSRLSGVGATGAFMLGAVVLCFVKHPKNSEEKLFDFGKKAQSTIDTNLLLSMGAALAIGNYLGQPDVGLGAFFSKLLQPLLTSVGPVPLIVILGLMSCLVTNFAINSLPVFTFGAMGVAVFADQPKYAAMMALVVLCCAVMALALPSSGGPALVIHSRQDVIKPQQLIGWGFLGCMLCGICICLLAVVFQNSVF